MSSVIISIASIIALLAVAGHALYRERSRTSLFLFAALTVTALLEFFDLQSLRASGDALSWKKYALIAESFLPLLWALCSLTFARQAGPWKIGRLLKFVIALMSLFCVLPFLFPLDAFFYAPDFPEERLLFLGNVGYFYYLGIMASLVFALVHFETTLANASPDAMWKIKIDIIGLGSILAVLIFYYSQALLYRTLNMNYVPLRAFLYLVAAAMMTYSILCRRVNVRIQVSRQAAFKSLVLVAVGVYLVMLGLLGEGMQYFGSSFPRTVTISFAFLVGIVLLMLLLSSRVRRELKVVLHKNFYQNKHDYRTQWLRFTEQLSTSRSGEDLLQCILSAYCDIFGIEGAALFLYEESRNGYRMTAEHEMGPVEGVIDPENSLVSFMKERGWVISIRDENPEIMVQNAEFFRKNNISFIVPLFAGERLEGFIVLGKLIKENEVFIYEDYDLMKTIARQASLAILHQRLSEQITQARGMEAIGKLSTFVAHDLKNLVTNLSLIVENASRYIQNPDFQKDMLASLGNMAGKMQTLIGKLKNLGEREYLNLQRVNLLELVSRTVEMITGSSIIVSGTPESAYIDENELQNVILNLLINGIEASGPNEPLRVEVGAADNSTFIRVMDQGCGMSVQFIHSELFKPFRTTKKQGLGIGLYQCRQIVEAHDGWIEVSSVEGHGSIFTVWLTNRKDLGSEHSLATT